MANEATFKLSLAILCTMEFDIYLVDNRIPKSSDQAFNLRAGEILHEKLSANTCVFAGNNNKVLHRYAQRYAVLDKGFLDFYDNRQEAVAAFKALKAQAALETPHLASEI